MAELNMADFGSLNAADPNPCRSLKNESACNADAECGWALPPDGSLSAGACDRRKNMPAPTPKAACAVM
eukprot:NODE_7576_length_314_cov_81.490566_g6838_i0.p3 GENE.NODE_7576_length_314_cov_81.490566_g6838_i0~~NODE_7576_length_314_cov_81.490566_g6838_i0.p3  ORF type:complete len:69 (+),score=15.85 NODE_7576_length_314_cov_81.490566_g6838_i0:65-271(+)